MQSSKNKNARFETARILKRRIAVFCAAIMAAICVLVAEAVIKEHNAAFDRERTEASDISAGFEAEVRGILDGVAGESEFLEEHIEEGEAEGRAFDLSGWKSKVRELASPTINITIIDADGKLRATTMQHASMPVSYSDRDFFLALRDNPNPGLFIGHPVCGRLAKRMVIPVTRRLNTPDGHFAGVLDFAIDPRLLSTLYRKVDLGRTGVLDLFFDDGTVFASYTSERGLDASLVGRKIKGLRSLAEAKYEDSGTFVKNSDTDGTRRLFSWRKVAGFPLIGVAGLGEGEALADANNQAKIVIGLGTVALSLPLTMMLMLYREISRRCQGESALVEETERARKANRVKSTFLATMSHELRTPLTSILGFSEIIRDKSFGADVDRYADYAGDIHRSGVHLLNIVNNILDVTKIEADKLELCEEKVQINQIIEGSLLMVEAQAAASGVSLTRATPDAAASIFGDRTKLKQIIINLLSNAIKFTPAGGSVGIEVIAEEDGDLRVMIRDTGIGMSKEQIGDALEPFLQVENGHSRRFDGTGLGLPLAVQLTELHGGTLTIESTPGVGTTAVVRFPASRITWD
ncbi:MAG: ATP-binding protein [Rhodomicrobium sp.]